MRKQHPSLLLHPFFIACLLLLLINDFVLKAQLHNWLTGKLSDFAGLAVFALFCTSLMPGYKSKVYVVAALLFLWWKSPLSQPFIQLCNGLHIPVMRVIDYSDYLALLVLPAAWLCKPVIYGGLYKKLAAYSAGTVSIFAFCATTMPYRYLPMSPTSIEGYRIPSTRLDMQQIVQRLNSMKIDYMVDSFLVYPESYFDVHVRSRDSDPQYFYTRRDSLNNVTTTFLPNDTSTKVFRRYATTPYILIHNLKADNEIIPAVRISFQKGYNSYNNIYLLEIELTPVAYQAYIQRPEKTRRYFIRKIYAALLNNLAK